MRRLRRVLGNLEVEYAANSRTGLFEGADNHYGEIWYVLGGQKIVERSTIEEVVLEQIYALAGVSAPDRSSEESFAGYPLAAEPRYARATFYVVWPLFVIFAWWLLRK